MTQPPSHPAEIRQMELDNRNAEILAHACIQHTNTAELEPIRWLLTDPDGEYKLSEHEANVWMDEFTPFILAYAPSIYRTVQTDVYRLLVATRGWSR